MIIYSSPPVVTRAVSVGVPPMALSLSRWVIALLIMLPFAGRKLQQEWPQLRAHLPSILFMGFFMIVGSTMSVLAVYFTTATNAVLVNASQPAITATLAWAIAGTRLLPAQRLGIACAFFGILVMIARADIHVLLGLDLNIGDFLMLLAVVGWSTYAVLLPRREYAPQGSLLMLLISAMGTVILLPIALVERNISGTFEFSHAVTGAMLYLGIFPTLLATFTWTIAIRAVGPNRAAIFVNLIPISGAALAMIFLGEQLHSYHLIGAVFVFAGIFLAVRRH